jgi:serine/threonine protein kinase
LDFNNKVWDEISEDAKELISNLLVKNPEERLTADEALKSSWIVSIFL